MARNYYQQAEFIKSAADLKQLPTDQGLEVAFVGRSNAGKSSALNRIVMQRRLAHTSKTPGRTQLINLFDLGDDKRLVDLPGYGYAKVAKKIKEHWQELLLKYLQTRRCLHGLVLLMDIRHPLQPTDCQILEWLSETNLYCHILITKADKLKPGARKQALFNIQKQLPDDPLISCQLFSATTGIGIDECRALLDSWFDFPTEPQA